MHFIFNISYLCLLTVVIINCQGGLVFRSDSDSSSEENKCGKHKKYTTCGSRCPPSCEDLYFSQEPKLCPAICVKGCFCEEKYYLSKNGECVKPEKCCQGENESYSICGSVCPETCKDNPICTLQCKQGCFCNVGYIRRDNSTNSACIKSNQC